MTAGEFPSTFAAQSGLKVACHTDAGTTANHIDVHDAPNVEYHHGAARNVSLVGSPSSFATNSTVLKFAAGTLKNTDLRRPINAFCTKNATAGNNNCASAVAKDSVFAGGTFIIALLPAACTTACTSATLSQPAKLIGGTSGIPIIGVVEHTNNRFLDDVSCAAAGSTITSSDAKFVATDIGKSVSGGPIEDGTFITSVTATVATLNQAHTSACTTAAGHPGDQITIGGSTFVGGVAQLFNADPMAIQLSNTTGGGQGFTCSGSTLAMTAGAKLDTGGFNANYIGLTVAVKGSGGCVHEPQDQCREHCRELLGNRRSCLPRRGHRNGWCRRGEHQGCRCADQQRGDDEPGCRAQLEPGAGCNPGRLLPRHL